MGLVKLGQVAVDGTKIRANTSRSKAMSHARMLEAEDQLSDEIEQIVAQMDELNAAEEQEHGDDDGGGGLPEELQLRERRRERIRAAREQLEREKGEKLEAKHQKSFADPEANMMKTEGSLQYCYNAQLATSEDGLIVANELTEKANDYEQLEPMVEAIETNTSQRAGILLADNGYLSEVESEGVGTAGTTGVDRGPRAEVVPLAQGSPGAADAPDLTTALGPATLRAAEDPGGAAVCRDQGTTAVSALHAARPGEGDGRVGPGVLGLQRDGALPSADGVIGRVRTRFAHVRPWI